MSQESGFVATLVAVLSAFVGIRRKSAYQRDAVHLKPVHVIVAGVVCGILFVLSIVGVVSLILK